MLQVITGTAKGRKLKVPKDGSVRPTTGRVKQSLFDTLGDISDLRVLDIFAGSGGLGIECLSREASHVTFVEKNPSVCTTIQENISLCGFESKATVICDDYSNAIKRLNKDKEKFNLVFIDPPYALYEKFRVRDFVDDASELVESYGVIIIEHDYDMEDSPAGYTKITKPFGGTRLSFFKKGDK